MRKICPNCKNKQDIKDMKLVTINSLKNDRYFCNWCLSGKTSLPVREVREKEFKMIIVQNTDLLE